MRESLILLLFLVSGTNIAQPKNRKELDKNCDQYVFNPQSLGTKLDTYLSPYKIQSVNIPDSLKKIYLFYRPCKKYVPVIFDSEFKKELESEITRKISNVNGSIPIQMNITQFKQKGTGQRAKYYVRIEYLRISGNSPPKTFYITTHAVQRTEEPIEKKLAVLINHSMARLLRADVEKKHLPFFPDSSQLIRKMGLVLSWPELIERRITMSYPCDIIMLEKDSYFWYSLTLCEYEKFIKPNETFGMVKGDSLFVQTNGNHFVYLKPIGNNYFIARNYIPDSEVLVTNSPELNVLSLALSNVAGRKVLYVFSPEGDKTVYSRGTLKGHLKKEEDLVRKYKFLVSNEALTVEFQETLIIELLRRQGKIPPQ